MKKLNRPAAPSSLSQYKYPTHQWGRNEETKKLIPSKSVKKDIWQALKAMQGNYCCYCENAFNASKIVPTDAHIEHFHPQSLYPAKTFDWDNLFGSCGKDGGSTCGHKKGNSDSVNLVKPDIDNPADFFTFTEHGNIKPRQDLTENEKQKAVHTISVLNLNHRPLVECRMKEIKRIRDEFDNLITMLPAIREKYLAQLKIDAQRGEFQAAKLSVIS